MVPPFVMGEVRARKGARRCAKEMTVDKTESDAETRLVARVVLGDPDALAELFRAHGQQVHDVAYGITRVLSDAEDVVQDIFAALPELLVTFEGRSSLWTWLHTVAVRAAWLRRSVEERHRRPLHVALARRVTSDVDGPVDRVALERALASIPAEARTVVWLKFVEGHNHAEIAEILGLTENASAVRLHRAKRLLRELLGGER